MNFKKVFILLFVLLLATGAWYVTFKNDSDTTPTRTRTTKKTQEKPVNTFDKTTRSVSDPNSIWVVVNKRRPLQPAAYRPSDLVVPTVKVRVPGHETMQMRREAAEALEDLFVAANKDGLSLMLSSAFRSYEYQQNLYNGYVKSQGQATADSQSARPGFSEHQTGLAADVRPINGRCELETCFGEMDEGKWVAAHAHEYGFIIRYTQDNSAVAGYSYEPWHIRYVGQELAQELHKQEISTLEAFFGLEPAPDYN